MPTEGPRTNVKALQVARRVARELSDEGATAVVLTGSHATGDARAHSDIDLIALFTRSRSDRWRANWGISHRAGHLVSVWAQTAAEARASCSSPRSIPTSIPGWQSARILHDPSGVAKALKRRARAFKWDAVAGACDAWVAEATTGWAEEVHKLVGMLEGGEEVGAAIQRSLLAIRLAPIIALHRRMLYGSENRLWDLVADSMGEPWASTQRSALAMDGETATESARAALRLYVLASDEVIGVLSEVQRAVVEHARSIALDACG